jgi:hypothetical protein
VPPAYLNPDAAPAAVPAQKLSDQAKSNEPSDSGFSDIPEEEGDSEWGEIDLGEDTSDLPSDGEYNGTIRAVDLSDAGDALYFKLCIELDGHPDYELEDFQTIAGRAGTEAEKRAKQGRRTLFQIKAATGINVSGNPFDLPEKLEDVRVRVKVARKKKDGEYDLVIRRYKPVGN